MNYLQEKEQPMIKISPQSNGSHRAFLPPGRNLYPNSIVNYDYHISI